MKKLLKILPILLAVLMVLMTCSPVLASGTSGGKTIAGVNIEPKVEGEGSQAVSGIGNQILGIIRVIGTIIAVGVLMVLGIKYMMGSAEEKAEYKKTMLPYLIGAVLLFAAVNLAAYIVDLSSSITKV
ncbi:MAG: pilin [Clostridia bacterium]|nr:pilin [Clostridia bacterium]